MTQTSLFPLHARSIRPSNSNTADLKAIARTEDGHDYALKGYPDRTDVSASEFIGYRLAHACGLAVPFACVVHDEQNRPWFGSRFEGAAKSLDDLPTTQQLDVLTCCGDQVSAALALALFCGDVDRRPGNFLARRNLDSEWAVLVFDFSRALFASAFPQDPWPQPSTTNTRLVIESMKHLGSWSGQFAVAATMRLLSISPEIFTDWLTDMPSQWINNTQRVDLASWWSSEHFRARVQSTLQML